MSDFSKANIDSFLSMAMCLLSEPLRTAALKAGLLSTLFLRDVTEIWTCEKDIMLVFRLT